MATLDNKTIAILGAGSWGTTLSWLFASHGKQVKLWSHQKAKADQLKSQRVITHPLKCVLPDQVEITSNLEEAISSAAVLIFCVSSQHLRSVAQQLLAIAPSAQKRPIVVSAAKGLELTSLKRMSQVLSESLPGTSVCALSGPNLAAEILQGMPTASVIGCASKETASFVQHQLNVSTFRLYTSDDIVGVELGGTLKNVIAIAAGCSDGLSLGANSKAALLTRGLAEITRLAIAMGAKPSTLAGLSGMGDLFATCTSPLSRNYRLGQELSLGNSLEKSLPQVAGTAEGVPTTYAVCDLANKLGLSLPIAEQVNLMLRGKTTPSAAISTLMSRPLVSE